MLARTVVDLLQCDDGVCGQALLRILVEQEGLWRHGPLLRWRHGRLVVRIHDEGDGVGRRCTASVAGRTVLGDGLEGLCRRSSISNVV